MASNLAVRVASPSSQLEISVDATTTVAQLLQQLPRSETSWGVRMLSCGVQQLGEGEMLQECFRVLMLNISQASCAVITDKERILNAIAFPEWKDDELPSAFFGAFSLPRWMICATPPREHFDLQSPAALAALLKCADIRLVRGEFLLELHADGQNFVRRQEAEHMMTMSGRSALVTHEEVHDWSVGRESRPCIAWCYERCNKPDQSQILKEMTAIAKDLRSNFVCKKKANSFVQWWLRAGMPWTGRHTVIFADWREAKPLLESLEAILLECGKSVDETLGKLIHVCIIAQSPKIYQRAMEWTKAMNRQAGFDVFDGLPCLRLRLTFGGNDTN
eukprot:g9293.t1